MFERAVSLEDIPADKPNYPEFCNSIFYIFNPATAARLVQVAKVRFIGTILFTCCAKGTDSVALVITGACGTLMTVKLLISKHCILTCH